MSGGSGLLSVLLNWIPAIVLLAVYIFFLRRVGVGRKQQQEAVEIQRRQADALERIAAVLERNPG